VFGVVLVSQLAGVVMALTLALVRGESVPGPVDIGWSAVAGALGVVGITALYRGLAVGRMGVVAPVTGVLAALIPVVAGFVLEGIPGPVVLVGIGAALVSVVLVTMVEDEGGGRAGLGLAVLAGSMLGLLGVAFAQISDGAVFAPLVVVRGVEAVLLIAFIVVTRSEWRAAPRIVPAIAAVGIADMAGNAFYLLAVQTGALAVAAVVSSLYPVTTVVLATLLLGERVTRSHAAGVALAALAIALIGLGNA